jgi:type II secretion system protein G
MVKTNSSNLRGFTLIELLVVMSIISLLSSIVFAQLNSAREKANNTAVNATMRNILIAFKTYHLDHGYYPPTELLEEAILAKPTSGTCEYNTWYGAYPPSDGIPSVNTFLTQYMGRVPTIPIVRNDDDEIECPVYHCSGDANPEDGCHGIAQIGYTLQGENSVCLPGIINPAGNDYFPGDPPFHVCGNYQP